MVRRGIAGQLFGRHVRRRSDGHAAGGHASGRERRRDSLGHAKVGHYRVHAAAQHIPGLDVAVNHPARMRVGERVHHIVQNASHRTRRERSAVLNSVLERLTLNEGHCVKQQFAVLAGAIQRNDVRMLQLRRHLDLATESLAIHSRREFRREHLDDHFAIERPLHRKKDAAHPAAQELALEHVRAFYSGAEI